MREQRAAARRLPFERRAKAVGVDGEQHEAGLAGAVFGRALPNLRPAREMDEAVSLVLRGARVGAAAARRLPFLALADVIDHAHGRRLTHPRATSMSKVLVEKSGRVAVVTINAPETRNTMTNEGMIEALLAAFRDVDADPGISAMILTGAGTAFSAGGDVKAMANRTGMFAGAPLDIAEGYRAGVQRIPKALYGLDVPTIAAVNGPAIGAGCDLAFMCDMR